MNGLGSGGVSPQRGGSLARCLSAGAHGAGRRRAATVHLPPGGLRRPAPRMTTTARADQPSSSRRAILSPCKITDQGRPAGRR
jgi:hypothetical protein